MSHFLSLILGDFGQVGKQVNRVSPGVAWKTENQAYAPSEALGNPNGSKFVYQNALKCIALDQHVEKKDADWVYMVLVVTCFSVVFLSSASKY